MSQKSQLLKELAGRNRGLLVNEADNVSLLSAIAQLEQQNPTPNPIEQTDLLGGNWRLLYTTSQDLLGFDNFPIVKPGTIYQCVRPDKAKVYNIAEIIGIPFLEGIISVVAEFSPVSEKRVNINFKRSISGLQRLLNYQNPDNYIEQIENGKTFLPFDFNIENRERQRDELPWLEITYLDEDLRISRGQRGSVFVLAK